MQTRINTLEELTKLVRTEVAAGIACGPGGIGEAYARANRNDQGEMAMTTRSVTQGLILGTDARAEIIQAKGVNPVISAARVLEDCLGDFDLMDPKNVGTTLLIDGADFSFLLPAQPDGEFTTIESLIGIYEHKNEGLGEVSDDIIDRYRVFFTSVYKLMTALAEQATGRVAIAV